MILGNAKMEKCYCICHKLFKDHFLIGIFGIIQGNSMLHPFSLETSVKLKYRVKQRKEKEKKKNNCLCL